ncbi:HD domain-containing protein [Candidatus Riflebacteria bacterium]
MIIRDCIHKDINLRKEFLPIIDCREYQRLRGIKQLGTTHLVYLTAVHTRFDHSLGCYHLSRVLLDALNDKGTKISERERLLTEAFALIHDLTHIPYGHTFEDERKIFTKHDRVERYKIYIEGTSIGETLEKLGIKEDLYSILQGSNTEFDLCYKLVAGTIGADLLDYLKRDAVFCGLNSRYDERIYYAFEIDDNRNLFMNLEKKGFLRRDLLSEIINLLRIRYYLSERVYYHHTKIVAGAMLSKAVETVKLPLSKLAFMSDEELLFSLDKEKNKYPIKPLIEGILCRKLFKRAFVVSDCSPGILAKKNDLIEKYHKNPQCRSEDEKKIADELGIPQEEVVIYCPPGKMFMKEADVPIKANNRGINTLSQIQNNELNAILDNYSRLWKFFVFIRPSELINQDRARQVCESFFTLQSEFKPD